MRTLLSQCEGPLVWGLFFATTIYGHVALKIAAGHTGQFDYARTLHSLTSFWGGSAMLAWAVSGLLWAVVLTKNTLVAANSISSLRYALISLAAWWFLRENLQPQHGLGIVLITAGIWFCTR